MALKLSTGLRNGMLDTNSFKGLMDGSLLTIYTGTPPTTADDAATGTVLVVISDNGSGGGLNFGAAASGSIPKDPAQVWNGTNVFGGTASYFRFAPSDDDGAFNTLALRVQGTCGTSGADMNMTSVNLSAGAVQPIDAGSFALPTF